MFWLYWHHYLNEGKPLKQSEDGLPQEDYAPVASEHNMAAEAMPEEAVLPAQDKYHYLTAFGNEALCVLSQTGACAYLSPNWQRIAGYNPEDCLGQVFLEKIHPEHVYKVRERLSGEFREGPLDLHCKCQITHADGSLQWYDVSFAALQRNSSGQPEFICVLRNIHADVLAQKTLHKSKLEAELALRARSEFLANMSHELRTPLNAILGFAQIMDSQMFGDINNPRYRGYISNIQDSGYNLLAKINDLLEIAHLDSGRLKLSEEEFDIMDVVRHVIQVHSHFAFTAHITIREQLHKDPIVIRADRVKMQQVLSNVLSNALRYNREGGYVTISSRFTEDDNLVISIKDSGLGLTPGHLSNIVNVFKQKDSFFSREMTGIGLGLSLVKEFVILHGGQFNIDSKSGKGTTVYITLPKERLYNEGNASQSLVHKQAV